MLLSGALAVSMAVMMLPAAAFAGSVTISKISTETADSAITYNAFKIFNATKNDDGTVSDITWASDAVKTATVNAIKGIDSSYNGTTAQAAAQWIAQKVTDTDATTIVSATSVANTIAKAVDDCTQTATVASGEATTLEAGYWLLTASAASTSGKVDITGTSPIFTVVGSDALTITPKTSVPTVVKQIKSDATGEYGVVADSQIGQAVDYKLTGTVANNVATYDTYKYEFEDTLTSGLELTSTNDVKVTVDDVDVTAQATISWSDSKLDVSFANLKALKNGDADIAITASTQVVVTYKAKLNASAVIGSTGNPNTVVLKYSNNPNTTSEGTSKPSTVRDYTYKLHLVKADKSTLEKLAGAKFTIQATGADDTASANLYVQADGSLAATAYEFTTGTDGVIDVAGLDAGTYTVAETTPPTDYKALSSSFTVTITPAYGTADDAQALTSLNLAVAGNADVIAGLDTNDNETLDADTNSQVDAAAGTVNVTVGNTKTIKLPLTGQQGIALCVIAGAVLVLLSLGSLYRRRRKQD